MIDPQIATERQTCRACGGSFDPLLELGTPCLSTFLQPDDPDPPTVPLEAVICQACDLVQLRHTVNPDLLYRQTYWYQSGINEAMKQELADVVSAAVTRIGGLTRHTVVLDTGANDGTLLSNYPWHGTCLRVAVEPAALFKDRLAAHAETVLTDFFPSAVVAGIPSRSITILTSIAMFYDLDDPKAFVHEVDRLLADNGVWIVQFQDLGQQIRATAFDNFCFEHLTYYSVKTFADLLFGTDLCLVEVERRAINGGSLRLYIQRRSKALHQIVGSVVYDPSRDELAHFAWRVGEHRSALQQTLAHLQDRGQTIDLYGASTKGNTLLQYCGFDHTLIRQAVERSPEKIGLVTPKSRIPIVSEETWREDPAPSTLVVIWQFRESILRREAAYLEGGGHFLFPLPATEVVVGART